MKTLEIISYLPLKLAVRCKILSKNFNTRISDHKFSQTWLLQHQKIISILIYSSDRGYKQQQRPTGYKNFHKISINSIPVNHYETTLPVAVEILASCKGLLLLNFNQISSFCVFNPITGAHQLIQHPKTKKYYHTIGDIGFAVDYPTSDQYKLVRVGKLAKEEGYKFQVFSSEGSGDDVWHEFGSRMKLGNTFSYLVAGSRPVYVHDSLHWLTCDRRILAFDTKRKEAIILNFPDFINHTHDFIYDKWLGVTQGLLTLICTFEELSIVIATYDYLSNNWRVSHIVANFIMSLDGYNYCFPICFDNKQALFLVNRFLEQYNEVYEYNSKMNGYKIAAVLDKSYGPIHYLHYTFEPTLASVHKTLSDTVTDKHVSAITATLDELRRFITDS